MESLFEFNLSLLRAKFSQCILILISRNPMSIYLFRCQPKSLLRLLHHLLLHSIELIFLTPLLGIMLAFSIPDALDSHDHLRYLIQPLLRRLMKVLIQYPLFIVSFIPHFLEPENCSILLSLPQPILLFLRRAAFHHFQFLQFWQGTSLH